MEVVTASGLVHFDEACVQRRLRILMLLRLVELLMPRSNIERVHAFDSGPEVRFGFFSFSEGKDCLVLIFSILVGDVFEADETFLIDGAVSFLDGDFSCLFAEVDGVGDLGFGVVVGFDWVGLVAL